MVSVFLCELGRKLLFENVFYFIKKAFGLVDDFFANVAVFYIFYDLGNLALDFIVERAGFCVGYDAVERLFCVVNYG